MDLDILYEGEIMAVCKNIEKSDISFSTRNGTIFCRYHRRDKTRPVAALKPEGFCAEAYHQLYPFLFSMLYSPYPEMLSQQFVVSCPAVGGSIKFELFRTKPKVFQKAINVMKRMMSRVRPTEILDYRVFIRVKSTSQQCPYPFKGEEIFEFNLGDGREICPAAFYNIFPSLISNIYGFNNEGCGWFGCPDHKTNIMFAINSSNAGSLQSEVPACCKPYTNLAIRIMDREGACNLDFKKGQVFQLKEVLERLGFPCISAFHSLYPYIYTLIKGGRLGFQTNNYSSAMVQCPNSSVKVEMALEHSDNKDIKILIKGTKSACPLGITANKSYTISSRMFDAFCYLSLVSLVPYILHPDLSQRPIFCCPGPNGKVHFELIAGV